MEQHLFVLHPSKNKVRFSGYRHILHSISVLLLALSCFNRLSHCQSLIKLSMLNHVATHLWFRHSLDPSGRREQLDIVWTHTSLELLAALQKCWLKEANVLVVLYPMKLT